MSDIEQVIRVIHESAVRNDARDWSALAALYCDDATLTRPNGQVVSGRAAIEASYGSGSPTRRTRHVCTNITVDIGDDGTATARTSVLLFTWEHDEETSALPAASGPAIGEFADRLVPTPDGWQITTRVATLSARLPPAG
jgi:ketosteroid isomerase-like protein